MRQAAFPPSFDAARPVAVESLAPGLETVFLDGRAHVFHQMQVEVQVVQGVQACPGDFPGALEVELK